MMKRFFKRSQTEIDYRCQMSAAYLVSGLRSLFSKELCDTLKR